MARSQKYRRREAAGRISTTVVEAEIAQLSNLNIEELRKAWVERLRSPAPQIRSRDVLLRSLAWRLQADTYGGLDTGSVRKLDGLRKSLAKDGSYEPNIRRDVSPGVVLMREWKGETHTVTAVVDGFQHRGKTYRSLSDIARTITGTRWSGPRFFGLEKNQAAASHNKSSATGAAQ